MIFIDLVFCSTYGFSNLGSTQSTSESDLQIHKKSGRHRLNSRGSYIDFVFLDFKTMPELEGGPVIDLKWRYRWNKLARICIYLHFIEYIGHRQLCRIYDNKETTAESLLMQDHRCIV
jgi:hypothetical protein